MEVASFRKVRSGPPSLAETRGREGARLHRTKRDGWHRNVELTREVAGLYSGDDPLRPARTRRGGAHCDPSGIPINGGVEGNAPQHEGQGRPRSSRAKSRTQTGDRVHGRCWTRTSDPYDVSVVLYQLS